MIELLHYEFMRNAIAAALLASLACGIIGSYVVVKKIGFISGGIAHSAFGGIGLGYFLGINPLVGLIPFSLAAAAGIGLLSKKAKVAEDTSIGTFWAAGMALGVLFIGLTPGYAPDLFSYLFGNILTVPRSDLLLILGLDTGIVGTVVLLYKEFLALSFDEEYAEVSGLKTTLLYLLLLGLIALTVVILVRVAGIVMVVALLTIPAAIARRYTRTLSGMMGLATAMCALFTLGGLWISWMTDVPSGASIILLASSVFLAVHGRAFFDIRH